MILTREEFILRFRGRLLVFMSEAWAVRRENPSALGLVLDKHSMDAKELLAEIYEALVPGGQNLAGNGIPPPAARRVNGNRETAKK